MLLFQMLLMLALIEIQNTEMGWSDKVANKEQGYYHAYYNYQETFSFVHFSLLM